MRLRRECRFLRQRVGILERAHCAQKQKADTLEDLLKERDRLIKELERQRDFLTEDIEEMKRQRDVYRGMVYKPAKTIKDPAVPEKKTQGGQKGHVGISKPLPSHIDQELSVFAHQCPTCQGILTRTHTTYAHTVEDIPAPQEQKTIVTRYTIERQWCAHCKKEVTAVPHGVIPHSKLGINLIVQILVWKYLCRMPFAVITQTLFATHGVSVSAGGLVNILRRTRQWLGPQYKDLLSHIRGSPIKHADETGWRIDGVHSWVWAFLTRQEVYYTIEKTRGKGVPQTILSGGKPTDVLVRDDYAGYGKLAFKHQSCWAHLLRKSHERVALATASEEMKVLHEQLKRMFDVVTEQIKKPFHQEERMQWYQRFARDLEHIIQTDITASDAKEIQTRIRHQNTNLLTALLHEGVPLTNNQAERMIRPFVVTRKISGGSRSDMGAEIHAVNMSIVQTIKMRHQPLIPTLTNYLLQEVGEN